ncbi:Glycoside hydrolase, family 19, catalytic [Dillenia turbinata]|uniref:Glycoside hydrolase, family 19, catalytic n=1 Tax=Dillenia turbinata TaxID=194707 RepID=A0AAN8UWX2_9MAGN
MAIMVALQCRLLRLRKLPEPMHGGNNGGSFSENIHYSHSILILPNFHCIIVGGLAQDRCGSQGGGNVCPGGLCCTKFGYCGSTSNYCYSGCGSLCPSISNGSGISSLISRSLFDQMLKHRNDGSCRGKGFYTYDAFVAAANSFPSFGTTGDTDTRKREIAAFLGQTSHETTGPILVQSNLCGWPSAPDGPYAWGYCYVTEQGNPPDYCEVSQVYPCASGKKYYGRGPIQISYNYNYGPAGKAINSDLLNNPDLVAKDATISFKTALWFWMTPQSPKPSCHAVMTGGWTLSTADTTAGRVPGYGVTTNIINGGIECGNGSKPQVEDRIGFYKRYCDLLSVGYGNNLDCSNQTAFNS